MIKRQCVVRDFFGEAEAMRQSLDDCFKNTYTQKVNWQYYCDPQIYTYLRTAPREVLPEAVFSRFMTRLRQWCMDNLGLVPVGMPFVHLMVNGCRLGLHSDFHNGAWGYVYSLTRWEGRKFTGGETLLLRDGIPSYKRHHVHADALFELIPAHFNQLLVFDDRIVHATPTIEGSMNPLDARIALVGHIRATSPVVVGEISGAQVRKVILEALPRIRDRIRNYRDVQGTITYRLTVGGNGSVDALTTLTENIITPSVGYDHSDAVTAVKSIVQQEMSGLRFPPSPSSKSFITVPVLIPIPDLRPIELEISHNTSRDQIVQWTATHMAQEDERGLWGSWDGDTLVVHEPVFGWIRVEPKRIAVSFDPPMWVPSQRESFQSFLSEWVRRATGADAKVETR